METYISIFAITASILGSIFIIRLDWKRYGLLFLISGAVGNILCYIFVKLNFYSFPFRFFPDITPMPFLAILTIFPLYVLIGVRYSPVSWAYKIPFYWAIVHLGMLAETLAQNYTDLIKYNFEWDFWDSYTWWWIYLLLFDWIGSLIIPKQLKKPLDQESFHYGKWVWALFHFIVITTIFLGGLYLGTILP